MVKSTPRKTKGAKGILLLRFRKCNFIKIRPVRPQINIDIMIASTVNCNPRKIPTHISSLISPIPIPFRDIIKINPSNRIAEIAPRSESTILFRFK